MQSNVILVAKIEIFKQIRQVIQQQFVSQQTNTT
jgi:hypothetical protein